MPETIVIPSHFIEQFPECKFTNVSGKNLLGNTHLDL
jgi:hypothetical protein